MARASPARPRQRTAPFADKKRPAQGGRSGWSSYFKGRKSYLSGVTRRPTRPSIFGEKRCRSLTERIGQSNEASQSGGVILAQLRREGGQSVNSPCPRSLSVI